MPRVLAAIGLLIALVGLGVQFSVSVPLYMNLGYSFGGSLVMILSFFTILTNIAAGFVYLADLTGKPAFFARRSVRDGLVPTIVVVGITYHFLLSQLQVLHGAGLLSDRTLHYVAPVFYVVWWAIAGRRGLASFHDLPYWLVYPLLYLAYALIRGALYSIHAYPFLDFTAHSASQVATSVAGIVVLFGVISTLVILADRTLPKPRPIQD